MTRFTLLVACQCLFAVTSGQAVPPQHPNWSQVVTATPDGGYLMGNPKAKITLVEFASMTSPHSAAFDEEGYERLIAEYVSTGRVSFEFRNYARDPFDESASLLARCGGSHHFFKITHDLFATQRDWMAKLLELSEDQVQALGTMDSERQFLVIAQLSGLQDWAATQGLTAAQTTACLTDAHAAQRLADMRRAVISKHPGFSGVPSFEINGALASESTWQAIEAELRNRL